MNVKNNYNECLTNFACSIRKYFDLDYKHNTLKYIDDLLEEKKPKNVVTILCDGMGTHIMDKVLDKNSFLVKNRIKSITTVFPATTVAATTSMMTGLNPSETGMLGWYMYYKDLDKIITTYLNTEKGDLDKNILKEAIDFKEKHMVTKPITEEINDNAKYKGYELFPFGENPYKDLDDMFNKIETLCNSEDKKYIYAYNTEPDSTMHDLGTDSIEAKDIIIDLNKRIESISKKVDDTVIFVVADHGHLNIINIDLSLYPDIVECLERDISLEPRAVNFFIKNDKKERFVSLFNKYFSGDFDLYEKEDVINSKLFGDGKENKIFRDILGDYLAIAKTNKALVYNETDLFKSQHAGYVDAEIYVPLIVLDLTRR